MREIKFRAWDHQKNIYGEVVLLERYDEWRAKENYGHKGRVTLWNVDNVDDCGSWGRWIELVDLEQYTGLKDKNGREIYEGDVCRYAIDDGIIAPVSFDNGSFLFGVLSLGIEIIDGNNIEVIGNLHEHKELLANG